MRANRLAAWWLAFAAGADALAQQGQLLPGSGEERADWQVQCEGTGAALDCRVAQTIVARQTNQLLLSVVVRRPPKETPALMLHLPHGLFLPAGVTVQVGTGKPQPLAIQTCDQRGCYAGQPLANDMLAAMQKADQLTVAFQDLKKQPISVRLALQGFRDAYAKLP
jgi:invasion protein IalB